MIEDQTPEEVLHRQISWLTMVQLSAAALEMCIPTSILQCLTSEKTGALHASDIAVARCTLDLLLVMLKKIFTFVGVVHKWASSGTLSYAQSMTVRRHITESLSKVGAFKDRNIITMITALPFFFI